jgi:hypothetical protein
MRNIRRLYVFHKPITEVIPSQKSNINRICIQLHVTSLDLRVLVQLIS